MTRQPRTPVQSPYYTIDEAAEILRVSRSTMKRRLADTTFTRVVLPMPKGAKRHPVRVLRREIDAVAPRSRRGRVA